MQVQIFSDIFKAKIDSFGAELHSLMDLNETEYIWQANEDVWKRHAPLLFPFICNTESKKYTCEGKEYALSNHGFARDSEFELLVCKDNSAEFCLKENSETLRGYPYKFALYANYTLDGNKLRVTYTVKNTDDKDIYFFIGGHPAFNCPIGENDSFEEYSVVYEKPENIIQRRADKTEEVILNNASKVEVTHELFANDVFMKNKPQSSWVALVSKSYDYKVKLHFDNDGCIAVWSSYFAGDPERTKKAEFVCLEPWSSEPVYCGKTEELTEMADAVRLSMGNKYSFGYTIEIGGNAQASRNK